MRWGKIVFPTLGIIAILATLWIALSCPSAGITPYIIRSPLRHLVSYTWNIGAKNSKDVSARMRFRDDQCILTIYGRGPMMDLSDGSSDFAWRKFNTMSAGWIVSITDVSVSEGVTNIGAFSFAGCAKLETVQIADTVECIGAYAFSQCKNLEQIMYDGCMDDWEKIELQSGWFAGNNSIEILCVDGSITEITGR